MRRIAIACFLSAALVAALPASAVPSDVVATQGSTYFPGDTRTAVQATLEHVKGEPLTYINFDLFGHSVTSDKCAGASGTYALPSSCPSGKSRLFESAILSTGQSGPVAGVPGLSKGTYGFSCAIHPNMRGALTII